MNDWEDKDQQKYDEMLKDLKSISVEPSPYLKTRVLANVREAESQSKKAWSWWPALVGSLATAFIAFVVSWQLVQAPTASPVEMGKPYLVKADLRMLEGTQPSYIKIELVGGVEFSSEKFAHIREMRSLTMSWERLVGKQYLPVVVKGVETGESHVRVYFYDDNNKVIKTQDFQLDFKRGTS